MANSSFNSTLSSILKLLVSISSDSQYHDKEINKGSQDKHQALGVRVWIPSGTPMPLNLEAQLSSIGWSAIHNQHDGTYNGKSTKANILIGPSACFGAPGTDDCESNMDRFA